MLFKYGYHLNQGFHFRTISYRIACIDKYPERFTKLDGEENKEEGDRVGQGKKRGLKGREQARQ